MSKKRKNDRRPKDQRSPYEPSRSGESYLTRVRNEYMVEKIEPMKCEQAIDAVQGCGDPNCPICLPESGRDRNDSVLMGGGSDMDMRRMMWDTMRSEGVLRSIGASPEDVIKRAAEERRRLLEAAEKQARGPVEKFILKIEHKVSWDDVIGNEEAHHAMIAAIEFPIKHGELFKFYNKKMTKGILLKGPPGCGKTMLGKAAAAVIAELHGTKSSAILSIAATQLQSPFVGKTEQLIKEIFAYARAYKELYGHQLVVFIDEADAILPSRNGTSGNRGVAGWEESNVATFLACMDGMENSGALVILATNRPEAIDGAVLRDGRIDHKITVHRPTPESARIIFDRAMSVAPVIGDRSRLVDIAMETFFDPLRQLVKIKHEHGYDFITMASVVSGAMMVGLVERIKKNAFERDLAAGTMTGIIDIDIIGAIERLTYEQREQPDLYAFKELAQRLKVPVLEVDRVEKPTIKYTGTLQ